MTPTKKTRRGPGAKTKEQPLRVPTESVGAQLLGVSAGGFHNFTEHEDFPSRDESGSWLASEIVAWDKLNRPGPRDDDPELEEAKRRKAVADAIKAEMSVAVAKGEMIPAGDIQRDWASTLSSLESEVSKGFHALAPKLSGLDAPSILVELGKWWRKTRAVMSQKYE